MIFGMLHFIFSRFFKNFGNVVIALGPGDFGVKRVFVPGLRFPGKCGQDVFFCFGAFDTIHANPPSSMFMDY